MPRIINFEEVSENYRKKQILLNKQCYIEDGYLILNVRYEYDIALGRCDTHQKVLEWVLHLSGKNWFSMDLMQKFIRVANEEIRKNKV